MKTRTRYSASEARRKFCELMETVNYTGTPITITKYGIAAVTIVPVNTLATQFRAKRTAKEVQTEQS